MLTNTGNHKLYCFSRSDFDNECFFKGWNDECCPENVAFISITGTEECQMYYLKEKEEHWFKQEHPNVLNISFDDIDTDEVEWEGHIFYGLQPEQAKEIVRFIEYNLGKDFWIHCRAGQSRSQGIVRFILDCYPEYDWKTRPNNPCITPNIDVVAKLKRVKIYDYL